MKIITVTLNPAFDIHCDVENFQLNKENYASGIMKHAGGKGINISRALCHFGIDNTAFCILGKNGGDEFSAMLTAEKIPHRSLFTDGRIRENITVHSKGKETRLSFEGFKINKNILNELLFMIEEEEEKKDNTIVTFTGRLCEGITKDDVIDFLLKIKNMGVKLIVDCNSFKKEELVKIKPFLIKPNEQEFSELTGCEIKDFTDVLQTAEELFMLGIENVAVSLGAEGFVIKNKNGTYKVTVPKITPVSTIGAGDSTIAGFIAGLSQNLDICETLKLSAAFGTAACLTPGTNAPAPHAIIKIKQNVVCKKIC